MIHLSNTNMSMMMDVKKPDPKQHIPYEICDEIALILTCSNGSITEYTREIIVNLLKKELNWDYVYRCAEKHGVVPLLYYNLKITAPELVPHEILQRMNEIYLLSMKRSMIQVKELLEVLQLGMDHRIPVIPYKGVALSQQIYGDFSLRLSSDIDIIVRQQDVIRAKTLLISQGYTSTISLTPEQDKKFTEVHSEHPFAHPHRTMIDIHWQFIPDYYLAPFKETEIWSGLKVISLEGRDVFTLSTEMLIITLLIHGAKHQWKELRQISDIAGIIASEKDINWELVLKISKKKRIERIIYLGLRLVEVTMKTELPFVVSEAIGRDHRVQHLVSSSINNMFTEEQRPEGDIQFVFYWVSVRECLWDKIRVISLLVFKPNHDDWAYISLPGMLSPLYYIIRPIRLAFEYGVKG
jgi:hypothetical protein